MSATPDQIKKIYRELRALPSRHLSLDEALPSACRLGKQLINSPTLIIALSDRIACESDNPDLKKSVESDSSLQKSLAKGEDTLLKEKYQLRTGYRFCLWSETAETLGCLYHFSEVEEIFPVEEKRLLTSFANRLVILLLEDYNYQDGMMQLCELPQDFIERSPDEFLKLLPDKARELLNADACIVWKKEAKSKKFVIIQTAGEVSSEYKKLELEDNFELIQKYYQKNGVFDLSNINNASDKFLHLEQVKKQGWQSMLSSPLSVGDKIIGILDIFRTDIHKFTPSEIAQFKCFSNYAALAFEKATNKDIDKLLKLNEIMLKMIGLNEVEKIEEYLLDGALELVSLGHKSINKSNLVGEVLRLNYFTGDLEVKKSNREKAHAPVKLGQGCTGNALKRYKHIRFTDVQDPKAQAIYVPHWEQTRSELAIPMYIDKIPFLREIKIRSGAKLIGVLNIESPEIGTFSQEDATYLQLLCSYAAILVDRLEYNDKLSRLRAKEREISQVTNMDNIMEIVMDSILDILEFHEVNISLIDHDYKRIQTKYMKSKRLTLEEIASFKKDADHDLNIHPQNKNLDIQAWVVKEQMTVVPWRKNETRYDKKIYDKYNHNELIRVFVPMLQPLQKKVIGTLEASYKKEYRPHIYEQDIRILESFVEYIANVIQGTKSVMIKRTIHEFRSPLVGIKSNASYLQRRREQLDKEFIDRKFDDILVDTEILFNQVAELEYIMGGSVAYKLKKDKILVVRDIIIKTIRQLKPIVFERGLPTDNIDESKINPHWIHLKVNTDKLRLGQVVYNLLINSIKYAKRNDPNKFRIVIEITEVGNNYVISFKDWGIGIGDQYRESIFTEGFRCPEAEKIDVTGSGLGLAISRSIMRELGGDLTLAQIAEPTNFRVILPKG
jgi:signal transduction histidine kinase/putative methionine-R-sulfoxide reductase with GAF domain